ncbi:MAG: arginine deiminase family protein [Candidatus Contendobacter sp.]|nr:arginine deiminase family protein [Candidatus Contendobacter sp.]MDG4558741.1 arginine deiminase family protein [Candidatus Contendobacter sp.]
MVSSYDEWSPLEAAIVGTAHGACAPMLDPIIRACVSPRNLPLLERYGGGPFPPEMLESAERELDGLAEFLRQEGIAVHRPDPIDHCQSFATPEFASRGLYAAMPRDLLAILGDTVLEASMGWRQRHFEYRAYRGILNRCACEGAGWLCAPKPLKGDDLYRWDYGADSPRARNLQAAAGRFVTTEAEPCLDAADMVRCGRDIFIQRSQVTNLAGIRWIRRHLPSEFRLHRLSFDDPNPMHLDSTIMPLRPGLLLVNPTRPCHQKELFRRAGWAMVDAPAPALPDDWPLFLSSPWLSMNLLVLDPGRVIVERQELPTIRLLRSLGFETVELPFRHVYTLGGGFHCATCDLRRRGGMGDYGFPAPDILE